MEQTREQLLDIVAQRVYDIIANGREGEAKNLIYSDDMIASQNNANFNINELRQVLEKKVGYLSHQNIKQYIQKYLLPENNFKQVDFHEKKVYHQNDIQQDFFDTSNKYQNTNQNRNISYTNNLGQKQMSQNNQSLGLSDDQLYRIFKGYDISNSGHILYQDIYFVILEVHQTNPNSYRSPSTQEVNQVLSQTYPNRQQFNIQQVHNIVTKFRKF